MINIFNSKKFDYVANTYPLPCTYPDGSDIEIFNFKSLRKSNQEVFLPSDKEHVTKYFWSSKKFKRIDVVINCFVNQNYETFEKQSLKKFSTAIKDNICGTFLVTKIFFNLLKKSNNAQIINFGSIYGIVSGDPLIYPTKKVTSDAYAASKAAIIQLTKYYAVHLSKYKIRVNCISPGGIFNNQNKKFIKNYIKKVPLKRIADLYEVVNGVKILMKNESKYINGHNLIIDGGYTIL